MQKRAYYNTNYLGRVREGSESLYEKLVDPGRMYCLKQDREQAFEDMKEAQKAEDFVRLKLSFQLPEPPNQLLRKMSRRLVTGRATLLHYRLPDGMLLEPPQLQDDTTVHQHAFAAYPILPLQKIGRHERDKFRAKTPVEWV